MFFRRLVSGTGCGLAVLGSQYAFCAPGAWAGPRKQPPRQTKKAVGAAAAEEEQAPAPPAPPAAREIEMVGEKVGLSAILRQQQQQFAEFAQQQRQERQHDQQEMVRKLGDAIRRAQGPVLKDHGETDLNSMQDFAVEMQKNPDRGEWCLTAKTYWTFTSITV